MMTTLLDIVLRKSDEVEKIATLCRLHSFAIVQDGDGHVLIVRSARGLSFGNVADAWMIPCPYGIFTLNRQQETADDYKTAIITSEEFYAELNKRASMKNAKSTSLETIEKETDEMTPQEIRNRVLVINSTIPTLISEREELIVELNRQGFSLIEETQPHTPEEDGVINLDALSDSEKFSLITQRTKFECIESHCDGFQKGEIYTVCRIDMTDWSVGVGKEDGDYEWFWKQRNNDDRLLFKYFKIVSLNGK